MHQKAIILCQRNKKLPQLIKQQHLYEVTICPVLQVCCVAREGNSEKGENISYPKPIFLKEKPVQMGY